MTADLLGCSRDIYERWGVLAWSAQIRAGCASGRDRPGRLVQLPNAQLHLYTPPDPTLQPPHSAFEVEDLVTTVAAPRERGVGVCEREHPQGFGYQAFVVDPAANLIELKQPN